MKKWAIYIALREMAKEHGDPLLGITEAETKEEAEERASRSKILARSPAPTAGLWAVEIPQFRTGDTVKHRPTGEQWQLAYADGLDVSPLGWPATVAKATDCELIEAASDAQHRAIVERLAGDVPVGPPNVDLRTVLARRQLAALNGEKTYRMHYLYGSYAEARGVSRREAGEGIGLCDALVLLAVSRGRGGTEMAITSMDGVSGKELPAAEQFKAWAVWAATLAEKPNLPDGMVNFLRQVVATVEKAATR
jgi:hypothetical protein